MNKDYLIGYYPFGKGTDQYMSVVAEESTAAGYRVIDLWEALKHPNIYRKLKIVNLNWFESINANSDFKIFLNYLKRSAMLIFFKMTGKKIVYTFHNTHPHNMRKFKWADKLISRLCHWSDRIVVLCDYSKEILSTYISPEKLQKKMVVIPPASYKGCYKEREIDFRKQWNVPKDACVMGYVGSVQPYKNIELIIEAAKEFPKIYFVIAGNAKDAKYRQELIQQAEKYDNIISVFRFVDNDELPAFVKNCDFIITPYDKRSSLNSGVAILAFTYGRTVICPVIGTLLQMGDLEHVFSYDYKNDEEHQERLNEAIERAYRTFLENPEKLAQIDEWVEEYVNTCNSRHSVRNKYKELYDSIISR